MTFDGGQLAGALAVPGTAAFPLTVASEDAGLPEPEVGALLQFETGFVFCRLRFVGLTGFWPDDVGAAEAGGAWGSLGEVCVGSCFVVPPAFTGADAGADWFLPTTGRAGSAQKIMMRRIAPRFIADPKPSTPTPADSNLLRA